MKKANSIFILFLVVWLVPYLWALREFHHIVFDTHLIGSVYWNSGLQAFLSTLLTFLLALPGAMGIFWLRRRWPTSAVAVFEFAILLPSLLPGLFVLVSFLNLIPVFPFGITGVVILHAFSEVGLAALVLHRLFQTKLSPYIDSAELMGCRRRKFLWTALPLVRSQILQILFVLFLFFLSSVSIPLILAGGEYSSLEAAIYQKIYRAHDWNQAMSLFLLQMIIVGSMAAVLGMLPSPRTENQGSPSSDYLSSGWGVFCILLPVAVILTSLLLKIPIGLVSLSRQLHVLQGWQTYLIGSLLLGFVSGGLCFVGLSTLTYFFLYRKLRGVLSVLITPSAVVLAFSFYLFPGTSPLWVLMKTGAALSLAFLPSLKRFGLSQKLETLIEQAESASLLGAGEGRIFWSGIWPQALPVISLLSGLGGVWAMGDFAMSRIISGSDITLAMWTQSLVDQYRWDIALVLSWILLAASMCVFGFFWSLSYVSHKKLEQEL